MMELDYQRVFNFTTKLAKRGMNHYLFEHEKPKRRLREDTYLWINETVGSSNEQQHVGPGCEPVNITDLPEAIDEAERN